MLKFVHYSFLLFVTLGCTFVSNEITNLQKEKLEIMVMNRSYKIDFDKAYPRVTTSLMSLQNIGFIPNNSTVGMIDITGHNQYFEFNNDTISVSLPYYGERQLVGTNTNPNKGGITFKGIPKNYSITKTKKGNYKIKFKINDKNTSREMYDVFILIFNNYNATVTINSTHRFSIEYRGRLKK